MRKMVSSFDYPSCLDNLEKTGCGMSSPACLFDLGLWHTLASGSITIYPFYDLLSSALIVSSDVFINKLRCFHFRIVEVTLSKDGARELKRDKYLIEEISNISASFTTSLKVRFIEVVSTVGHKIPIRLLHRYNLITFVNTQISSKSVSYNYIDKFSFKKAPSHLISCSNGWLHMLIRGDFNRRAPPSS